MSTEREVLEARTVKRLGFAARVDDTWAAAYAEDVEQWRRIAAEAEQERDAALARERRLVEALEAVSPYTSEDCWCHAPGGIHDHACEQAADALAASRTAASGEGTG